MTAKAGAARDAEAPGTQRLDQWLWFARVTKSRTLAATLISDGRFRINRERVDKPSQSVRIGDVITASVGRQVRIFKVAAIGKRRGPPAEALLLFEELTAPANPPNARTRPAGSGLESPATAVRAPGAGRPTKRDRRAIDRLKSEDGA